MNILDQERRMIPIKMLEGSISKHKRICRKRKQFKIPKIYAIWIFENAYRLNVAGYLDEREYTSKWNSRSPIEYWTPSHFIKNLLKADGTVCHFSSERECPKVTRELFRRFCKLKPLIWRNTLYHKMLEEKNNQIADELYGVSDSEITYSSEERYGMHVPQEKPGLDDCPETELTLPRKREKKVVKPYISPYSQHYIRNMRKKEKDSVRLRFKIPRLKKVESWSILDVMDDIDYIPNPRLYPGNTRVNSRIVKKNGKEIPSSPKIGSFNSSTSKTHFRVNKRNTQLMKKPKHVITTQTSSTQSGLVNGRSVKSKETNLRYFNEVKTENTNTNVESSRISPKLHRSMKLKKAKKHKHHAGDHKGSLLLINSAKCEDRHVMIEEREKNNHSTDSVNKQARRENSPRMTKKKSLNETSEVSNESCIKKVNRKKIKLPRNNVTFIRKNKKIENDSTSNSNNANNIKSKVKPIQKSTELKSDIFQLIRSEESDIETESKRNTPKLNRNINGKDKDGKKRSALKINSQEFGERALIKQQYGKNNISKRKNNKHEGESSPRMRKEKMSIETRVSKGENGINPSRSSTDRKGIQSIKKKTKNITDNATRGSSSVQNKRSVLSPVEVEEYERAIARNVKNFFFNEFIAGVFKNYPKPVRDFNSYCD
ncbi:origin recognition complex subunit 1-like [Periplaneta americana]|uniref:origin recognition complex subunit 1-like n=1 Tax=Periplaneta americana TaxID=6978 RepID=UPI0037E70254